MSQRGIVTRRAETRQGLREAQPTRARSRPSGGRPSVRFARFDRRRWEEYVSRMLARERNSFGFVVGQQRWSHGQPFMRVGRNREGHIVGVEDVPRGYACDSRCACCGERLSARQGEEREWHFAHQPGEHCSKVRWLSMQAAVFLQSAILGKQLALPVREGSRGTRYGVRVDDVAEAVSFEPLVIRIDVSLEVKSEGVESERRSSSLAVVVKLPWDRDLQEPDWVAERQRAISVDLGPFFSHRDEQIVEAFCSSPLRRWLWNDWPKLPKPRQQPSGLEASAKLAPSTPSADVDARFKRFWSRGRGR